MNRRGFLKFLGFAAPAAAVPALERFAAPPHLHEKRDLDLSNGTLVISKEECRDPNCGKPILKVEAINDTWERPQEELDEIFKTAGSNATKYTMEG